MRRLIRWDDHRRTRRVMLVGVLCLRPGWAHSSSRINCFVAPPNALSAGAIKGKRWQGPRAQPRTSPRLAATRAATGSTFFQPEESGPLAQPRTTRFSWMQFRKPAKWKRANAHQEDAAAFSTGALHSTTAEDLESEDEAAGQVGGAHMSPGAVHVAPSVPEGRRSSLDRLMDILAADDTKKLGAWTMFLVIVARLRSFYSVILGTFVLSYMGNTVIGLAMDKGNKALKGLAKRTGWKRLPKNLPRTVYASAYMVLVITALTSLSVTIVPRLTVESQLLIQKISEQDNPYAIIAEWMQSNFGEEALSRLEPFMLSITGDEGRIFAGYPDNYLDVIASKLEFRNRAARWSEERFARFAKLLQYSLSRYFKGGLNMCKLVVTGLTKVLYKTVVSLLFSFMVIWDLPNLRRGVRALKTSRLGFGYRTIAPQVATFAKLVGQSFEVQFTIAAINTLLTTGGLIFLGISGPLVLSFIVFLCSFVPVLGVFLSTLPMVVAALGDYGMSKVFQVILMVLGVHAVEAYLLNPQIYASKLKLHPVVVICVLYMAEHLVGVQGLIIAVPFAVYVINNLIMKENPSDEQASMVDKAGPAEIAVA